MKKELRKCLEICKSWKSGKDISFEDICTLAYTDLRDLGNKDWHDVSNVLHKALQTYGDVWSEYDKYFPRNTYRFGYVLENHVFVTGYTGVAGRYWMDDTGMLCDDE